MATREPEPESPTVTARVRSVVTCVRAEETDEETRPGLSAERGIWVDIRCTDPALVTTLEALSLALGDVITITKKVPGPSPVPVLAASVVSSSSLDTNDNLAEICLSPVIPRPSEVSLTVPVVPITASFRASSPVVAPCIFDTIISPPVIPAISQEVSPAISPEVSPVISPEVSSALSYEDNPALPYEDNSALPYVDNPAISSEVHSVPSPYIYEAVTHTNSQTGSAALFSANSPTNSPAGGINRI